MVRGLTSCSKRARNFIHFGPSRELIAPRRVPASARQPGPGLQVQEPQAQTPKTWYYWRPGLDPCDPRKRMRPWVWHCLVHKGDSTSPRSMRKQLNVRKHADGVCQNHLLLFCKAAKQIYKHLGEGILAALNVTFDVVGKPIIRYHDLSPRLLVHDWSCTTRYDTMCVRFLAAVSLNRALPKDSSHR